MTGAARAEKHVLPARLVANARMYSTTSRAANDAWMTLLRWIVDRAGGDWDVMEYPATAPLDDLWARDDLGCTFMCGLPYSWDTRELIPIAAPVVRGERYGNRPVYFTDIVVRKDSPYRTLEDTFGSRLGYTVKHSQSGYMSLREHLLPYRRKLGHSPYREIVGPLGGARDVIEAVLGDRIDVGPMDSYVLDLVRNLRPDLAAQLRVIETTRASPIPLFIATARFSPALAGKLQANLRDAFAAAATAAELQPQRDALLIADFAMPTRSDYEQLSLRAQAAGAYPDVW
jgi:ABC-type phosphate/phosphonate transport system substrate-binding protein